MQYNRPKVLGRVPKTWFTKESIAEDHMKGFSSDILGMIPLLCAFLVDLVEPMGILGEHIQCFKLLAYLIDILSLSCDVTPQIYNALRTTVDKHTKLFKKLYPDYIKVKFHHSLHLREDLRKVGKLISCFTTERKHKDVKANCLHVFRHVEHTTTMNFVNEYVQLMTSGDFQFSPKYLMNPTALNMNSVGLPVLQCSVKAQLQIGEVRRGDLLLAELCGTIVVAKVDKFFSFASSTEQVIAQVMCYQPLHASIFSEWNTSSPQLQFIDSESVKANLMWMQRRPGVIRVILPSAIMLK